MTDTVRDTVPADTVPADTVPADIVPVDWPALRAAAVEAMKHAYAPYSHFPVGAAGLAADGRVVVGCNVENAGYGVTLCAECGMVSALVAGGGGRLVAVACVDGSGEPLMPCGRCRQVLMEHGGDDCWIDAPSAPVRLGELLPRAFGPATLRPEAPRGERPEAPRGERPEVPRGERPEVPRGGPADDPPDR